MELCKMLQQQKKVWKTKIESKNKGNKQKTVINVVDTNPAISIITLNTNGLKTNETQKNCHNG